MAVGFRGGAPQDVCDRVGHVRVVGAYHKAHGIVKQSQLLPYYKALCAGQPNKPSKNGLNDLMAFAWRTGLAP